MTLEGESRWHRTFELAPTPMAICTRDGTIRDANRAARVLLGSTTRLDPQGELEALPIDPELTETESLFEIRARRLPGEEYQVLFDRSPLPLFVYDVETLRYLAVNDAAVRHYGYSREEFLTMGIMDIRPTEDAAPLARELGRLGPGSDPLGIWRHRKRDGTIFEVEINSHSTPWAVARRAWWSRSTSPSASSSRSASARPRRWK